MPQHTEAPAQSTVAEFAEAIGRAVLAWQDVEVRCAHVFVAMLDARNTEGALKSFHAVHSLSVRAVMLKTAAWYLTQSPDFEDLGADFSALMDDLGKCSRLRNRLTHSEVTEELTETGWAYSLRTPDIDVGLAGFVHGGRGRGKSPPLDFPVVKSAEVQFWALAKGLNDFEARVRERLESY